jgi:hypothetical protein
MTFIFTVEFVGGSLQALDASFRTRETRPGCFRDAKYAELVIALRLVTGCNSQITYNLNDTRESNDTPISTECMSMGYSCFSLSIANETTEVHDDVNALISSLSNNKACSDW